jgi:hypothetical protein
LNQQVVANKTGIAFWQLSEATGTMPGCSATAKRTPCVEMTVLNAYWHSGEVVGLVSQSLQDAMQPA